MAARWQVEQGAAVVTILLQVDSSFTHVAGSSATASEPIEIDLELSERYDTSIIALTRAAGISIEADDDQLGIIFSLQHARSKFYVEGSMLCGGAKQNFWQNEVKPAISSF